MHRACGSSVVSAFDKVTLTKLYRDSLSVVQFLQKSLMEKEQALITSEASLQLTINCVCVSCLTYTKVLKNMCRGELLISQM